MKQKFASQIHMPASEVRGPRCGWRCWIGQRGQFHRRAGGGKVSHRPQCQDEVRLTLHPIGTLRDLGTGREWIVDTIGAAIVLAAFLLAWIVL